MVSIKWPLVLLLLSVVCSARKPFERSCKNLIKTNRLVKNQEWKCLYPEGQLVLTGHFTLNQKINVRDLKVIAVTSMFDPIKSKFVMLWETKFDFCNQNKLQWEGRWGSAQNQSGIIDALCQKEYLKKGKTYYINNWPIVTQHGMYVSSGWYSTNVLVAIEEKEERRKSLRIIIRSGEEWEHIGHHKKKKHGKSHRNKHHRRHSYKNKPKKHHRRYKTPTPKKEAVTHTGINNPHILFNIDFIHHEPFVQD